MKKIAVVGVGSGGILSLCHLLNFCPDEIYSIYDPAVPSVGIGESTNPFFWSSMHRCLGVSLDNVLSSGDLNATKKYGTYYKNWREEDFLNPLFGDAEFNAVAIHFNTFKIKDFVFRIIKEKYKNRFFEINGSVSEIKNIEDKVLVNINDHQHIFDFVVDCRGFPKNFNNYTVLPMPLNHCLVHNIPSNEGVDWGHTLHQATEHGWMFGVPLTDRLSYGYLFNNQITDINDAKEDFSKTININVEELEKIEYRFNSYYSNQPFNGRIIKNGNTAFFLEPMFANSLWIYDYINRLIIEKIKDNIPEHILNSKFQNKAREIHDLMCYQYHGGSLYKSKFWNYAIKYSSRCLEETNFIQQLQHKVNNYCLDLEFPFGPKNLRIMDKNFNYRYW